MGYLLLFTALARTYLTFLEGLNWPFLPQVEVIFQAKIERDLWRSGRKVGGGLILGGRLQSLPLTSGSHQLPQTLSFGTHVINFLVGRTVRTGEDRKSVV